ncbi:MAG: AAA family ATPase [Candidatus Sumerlaeota bacterium]|nr:AAA family ATPase [Candidatus Sumerlaeota bacterium]
MYINSIRIRNLRVFSSAQIDFIHSDMSDVEFENIGFGKAPQFPNVNLLLGNNGYGKTTLLKAISLAALGPAAPDSGIRPYRLIRQAPICGNGRIKPVKPHSAVIEASFTVHEQDHAAPHRELTSHIAIEPKGDIESIAWKHPDEKRWHPIYSASSDAFFVVGYGTTRRVENPKQLDVATRKASAFERAQRVMSLFEDIYSFIPLNYWLPELKHSNPGRHKQVVNLINLLMGEGHYRFTSEMYDGEYLYEKEGMRIPFPALSDGYRAYLGWIGDLLYHVCQTCPPRKKLTENKGIVMVDEIDLLLHPNWQRTVLQTLSRTLPNIQFIVTSHSPLVAGSLEWMNIIHMKAAPNLASEVHRIQTAIHGLDADQILLTEFFGLTTTRADERSVRLKELTLRARSGNSQAALALIKEMSMGMESVPGNGGRARKRMVNGR